MEYDIELVLMIFQWYNYLYKHLFLYFYNNLILYEVVAALALKGIAEMHIVSAEIPAIRVFNNLFILKDFLYVMI